MVGICVVTRSGMRRRTGNGLDGEELRAVWIREYRNSSILATR